MSSFLQGGSRMSDPSCNSHQPIICGQVTPAARQPLRNAFVKAGSNVGIRSSRGSDRARLRLSCVVNRCRTPRDDVQSLGSCESLAELVVEPWHLPQEALIF